MKRWRKLTLLIAAATVTGCVSMDPSMGDLVAVGNATQDAQAAEDLQFTPQDEYFIGRSAAALVFP